MRPRSLGGAALAPLLFLDELGTSTFGRYRSALERSLVRPDAAAPASSGTA
jgi:hypothetical protein